VEQSAPLGLGVLLVFGVGEAVGVGAGFDDGAFEGEPVDDGCAGADKCFAGNEDDAFHSPRQGGASLC
jgi:hypothetical protein